MIPPANFLLLHQLNLINQNELTKQMLANQTPTQVTDSKVETPEEGSAQELCKADINQKKESDSTPTSLLAWFPKGKDTILSDLLKEHSAQEIKIPLTGIPKRSNNKSTICNPVIFTVIEVPLKDLIKNFLEAMAIPQPKLYQRLLTIPGASSLISDDFKDDTINIVKRHKRTAALNRPVDFTITAQELVNLLRRKTEKLLTTPV